MSKETYRTTLAQSSHTAAIVDLSTRVQAALTASGSLQVIGPLKHDDVLTAISEQRCFILPTASHGLIGCAMIKPITEAFFSPTPDFSLTTYPPPWHYIHSVMLEPGMQGRGIGREFFQHVVGFVQAKGGGGTLVLDFWAGNGKLRQFYERCGCAYVATVPEERWEIAVFVKVF